MSQILYLITGRDIKAMGEAVIRYYFGPPMELTEWIDY